MLFRPCLTLFWRYEDVDALEKEAQIKEAEQNKKARPNDAKKSKKVKTANQLDERFQLTPEHDREYIFDEERDMIQELRNEIEDLRFYTDKWICYWLFSRDVTIFSPSRICSENIFNYVASWAGAPKCLTFTLQAYKISSPIVREIPRSLNIPHVR
jgi:hypothetical protein